MHEGDLVRLLLHGCDDLGDAMPDVYHRDSSNGVKVLAPRPIVEETRPCRG